MLVSVDRIIGNGLSCCFFGSDLISGDRIIGCGLNYNTISDCSHSEKCSCVLIIHRTVCGILTKMFFSLHSCHLRISRQRIYWIFLISFYVPLVCHRNILLSITIPLFLIKALLFQDSSSVLLFNPPCFLSPLQLLSLHSLWHELCGLLLDAEEKVFEHRDLPHSHLEFNEGLQPLTKGNTVVQIHRFPKLLHAWIPLLLKLVDESVHYILDPVLILLVVSLGNIQAWRSLDNLKTLERIAQPLYAHFVDYLQIRWVNRLSFKGLVDCWLHQLWQFLILVLAYVLDVAAWYSSHSQQLNSPRCELLELSRQSQPLNEVLDNTFILHRVDLWVLQKMAVVAPHESEYILPVVTHGADVARFHVNTAGLDHPPPLRIILLLDYHSKVLLDSVRRLFSNSELKGTNNSRIRLIRSSDEEWPTMREASQSFELPTLCWLQWNSIRRFIGHKRAVLSNILVAGEAYGK